MTGAKKKQNRPDRILQRMVISLAYSLVALTVSLVVFILYPQYFAFSLTFISIITLLCLILSLQTLKAAEKAINYGGFANEIIRQSSNAKRIETYNGKIVIENESSRDLFNRENIIEFLEKHLSDYRNNTFALQQIKNAYEYASPV